MKKIATNKRIFKSCSEESFSPLKHHHHYYNHQYFKLYYCSYSNRFRKVLEIINNGSKQLERKLDEYRFEFKNVFFNAWDDTEYNNNYLRSKSDKLSETKKETDYSNITQFEPLFEKDLFLFFVFKNHLLVKYLEITKDKNLIEDYSILFSEGCVKDLNRATITQLYFPKVETIQSMDILNITFSYKDGYMNIIMDIEMYFYCDEGFYFNTIFKIEKHFTKETSTFEEKHSNELELLEQMISGWRIKLLPLLIKIE